MNAEAAGAPRRGRAAERIYALLTDGSTAEIRPARSADAEAVRAMHEAMSPENLYLRFFSVSPRSAEAEAKFRAVAARGVGHHAFRHLIDRGDFASRHDRQRVVQIAGGLAQ